MSDHREELRGAAAAAEMQPIQETMSKDSVQWQNAVLNPGGMILFANETDYQYKLPYTIQQAGRLSRIHPMCLCCDKTCCRCLSTATAKPVKFMDMVDQESGEQMRYQTMGAKPCGCCPCRKPHVMVWHNGQRQGFIAEPTRFFNRCLTCLEQVRGHDRDVLGLYDERGARIAAVVKKGWGCCLDCKPSFPLKCMPVRCFGISSSALICVACTVEAWPTPDPVTCSGIGILSKLCCVLTDMPYPCLRPCGAGKAGCSWGLIPHGCISCDPVCGECCIRGPVPKYRATNFPLCCCCIPCTCLMIACPSCYLERRELPFNGTFRYETMEIKSHGQLKGKIQFQHRGNYPSAYVHEQSTPFTTAMNVPDGGKLGLLATAVMMARSYTFGLPQPLLQDLPATSSGPNFDGWCQVFNDEDVLKIMQSLDDNNNVVKECTVGKDLQLKGYTLAKIGYDCRSGKFLCLSWGAQQHRKPVDVVKKSDTVEIINNALANMGGKTWHLLFFMKDPEKPILTKRLSKDIDSKFKEWFMTDMQEVNIACACVRFWHCPCKFTRHRSVCCRIPLLLKPRAGGSAVHPEPEPEKGLPQWAPEQVVMHIGSHVSQKYAKTPLG